MRISSTIREIFNKMDTKMEFILMTLAIFNLYCVILRTVVTSPLYQTCGIIETRYVNQNTLIPRHIHLTPVSTNNHCQTVRFIRYTHSELKSLNKHSCCVPNNLHKVLSDFGLYRFNNNKNITKRNNRRGTRAGKHKKRSIQVIVNQTGFSTSSRDHIFQNYNYHQSNQQRKINTQNLICIDTQDLFTVKSNNIQIGVQNCQSCKNKMGDIKDTVVEENIDMMFLTETWLFKSDVKSGLVNNMKPPGYDIRSFPRKHVLVVVLPLF